MILGVMGQARSGKDTFADFMVHKFGFVRIALADPIKRIAMDVYEMTEDQLWGDGKELPDLRYPLPEGRGFLTPRTACQLIGTEVVRNLYPDTWVGMFKRAAKAVLAGTHTYDRTKGLQPLTPYTRWFKKTPQGVICSDVRFKNEVKGLHSNGLVIRLKREGKEGDVGIKGHASEEEQKSIPDSDLDAVLRVPEGLDNYHVSILALIERLPKTKHMVFNH